MAHELIKTTVEFGRNERQLQKAASEHLAAIERPL
jgi:hypothetical protein